MIASTWPLNKSDLKPAASVVHQHTWGLQEGALCWVGRAPRAVVQGQATPRGEMEDRGPRDHLGEVDRGGPAAVGWD